MRACVILVACALVLPTAEAVLGCKNLQGKDVDWFMAYKLPSGTKDSKEGRNYMYIDQFNTNWTLSPDPIESTKSGIGATVNQIYGNQQKIFYVMFNDDNPINHKTEGYRGHLKGVLGFDSKTGFWIQHSMPNFPPTEKYDYPDSATKFGQTLICMTMDTKDLGDIGEQLRYMQINPYAFNIPKELASKFPVLKPVIEDKDSLNTRKETKFTSTKILKTLGGQEFTSFAKHRNFNQDVWAGLVAKEEGVPFAVATWLNGAAKDLESTCSPDVTVLDVSSLNINGNTFTSSKDHSKWGSSQTAKKPVVCVGDMNRQESQMDRGGGALCLSNSKVWKSWTGIIDSIMACK